MRRTLGWCEGWGGEGLHWDGVKVGGGGGYTGMV